MGILSDLPLSSPPTRLFQFRLKLHTAAHRFFDLFFGHQDRDRSCKEAEQKDRNEIADLVPEGSPKKSGLRQKNSQIGRCRTHTPKSRTLPNHSERWLRSGRPDILEIAMAGH